MIPENRIYAPSPEPPPVVDSVTSKLPVKCAWCGKWKTPEGFVDYPEKPVEGFVSHGICPACASRFMAGEG